MVGRSGEMYLRRGKTEGVPSRPVAYQSLPDTDSKKAVISEEFLGVGFQHRRRSGHLKELWPHPQATLSRGNKVAPRTTCNACLQVSACATARSYTADTGVRKDVHRGRRTSFLILANDLSGKPPSNMGVAWSGRWPKYHPTWLSSCFATDFAHKNRSLSRMLRL
jgi:hypothetical protein